jgi:NMT1-like family
MALREFLRSNWHVVTIAVTAGVVVCAALFLLSSMPPRSIAMATGPEGGGYYEIGKQYQELLARNGVKLRLVATLGSVENLALLRDPKSGVDIALVQGGSTGKEAASLSRWGHYSTSRCGSSTAAPWRARHWPPCAAGRSRSDRWAVARMRSCSVCSSSMRWMRG